MILNFVLLPIFTFSVHGQWLAETSYGILHGQCPQATEPPPAASEGSPYLYPQRYLQKDIGEISEKIYLGQLAQNREEALQCESESLEQALKNQEDAILFAEDTVSKLDLLAVEVREMNRYEQGLRLPTIGSDLTMLEEYKKHSVAAETIQASLLHYGIPVLKNLMTGYVLRFSQNSARARATDADRAELKANLITALAAAGNEVKVEREALRGALRTGGEFLSEQEMCSLAQDVDLVSAVHVQNQRLGSGFEAISCRVDAKFGRGAKYAAVTTFTSTLVLSGVAWGIARLGASVVLASQLTRAAAVGTLTLRTASIFRAASLLIDSGATFYAIQVCGGNLQADFSASLRNQGSCERVTLKSINRENCYLTAALGAIGVKVATGNLLRSLKGVWNVGEKSAADLEEVGKTMANARAKATAEAESGTGALSQVPTAKSYVDIPVNHRPQNSIPFSGEAVKPLEVRSEGRLFNNADEVKAWVQTPEFKQGTYTLEVVRGKDGHDRLLISARMSNVEKGKWVSHRALDNHFRETHDGEEPVVTAAGEAVLNPIEEIFSLVNRAGSRIEGNDSPDYLMDVMRAYGFKTTGQTLVKTVAKLSPQEARAGHLAAEVEIALRAEFDLKYPGLLEKVTDLSVKLHKTEKWVFEAADPTSRVVRKIISLSKSKDLTPEQRESVRWLSSYFLPNLREDAVFAIDSTRKFIYARARDPEAVMQRFPQMIDDFFPLLLND